MVYKLNLKTEAKTDIIDGFYWYERKSEGLGSRFVHAVEETLNHINKYPLHFQVKYNNFRQGIIEKFPFVIIYRIFDDEIIVFAVFPTKVNPKKKPQ
ncbi:MAG: type II toxin-antitoxin system RelE/ParE family toxin [Bacteroidetes bacterium]|nr:MAG: type II toxin-antitoxin system RelE/ParE family toxin [Bacteroidota bacterium]